MTYIKNTDELVKTALEHKIADHVANNVYAMISGKHNGERTENWSVCAIGCLATPSSLEKLVEEYPDNVEVWTENDPETGEKYTFYDTYIDDDVLIDKLSEKFGICSSLARAAETFFEGTYNGDGEYDHYEDIPEDHRIGNDCRHYILSNDERANFPHEFAKALNEGAEITDEMVIAWFNENDIRIEVNSGFEKADVDNFLDWLRSIN